MLLTKAFILILRYCDFRMKNRLKISIFSSFSSRLAPDISLDQKINLFFIGLLDSELFKGAAHTLMRQPLLHKEKHCATRVLLVTHFYRKPPLEEGYAGEIAVTGGLIDRFRLADQWSIVRTTKWQNMPRNKLTQTGNGHIIWITIIWMARRCRRSSLWQCMQLIS